MRRLVIIISILLASTSVAFSQEMQLKVVNKPLNTVLNMLGMEISFDDKALSTYNVSVSKTFKEPEDALYYLLSDKPFKIEKVNHVYIIVPTETKMAKNNPITVSIENNDKFVFTGTVSDIGTKEPLLYAAVCLLNSDNQPIATGITNDKGIFRLISSQFPQKIKISFIGYETMTRDIPNFNVELGMFSFKQLQSL